ncbi:PKD domain-containing protein [Fodinibius halophilus]|uniref:PKD domain-containing protein n=1 Tax=Fodinibius halophilus TaxID=1736908 RepID=A0A6M1TJF7_9BACT|nr:PKD domain-containing protein [Fodinibius halophilus]NGP90182.1 PKD domain-containing protein [Fodinibius halophilus]
MATSLANRQSALLESQILNIIWNMHYRPLTILSVFILSLSLFVACSSNTTGPSEEEQQEEPLQLPTASFSVEGDMFTGGEIQFNNSSKDADSYTWEFGDGTTANESNPTKSYTEYGKVTVTLTAKNEDGEDSISKTITVEPKTMFIKKIEIVDMPFTNENGEGWDTNSAPDVFINLLNDVGGKHTMGSTYTDLGKSDLPAYWEYQSPGLEIGRVDFDTNFIFSIIDEDEFTANEFIESVPTDYFTIRKQWLSETPETAEVKSDEGTIRLTLEWE